MLQRARLPEEHALFLDGYLPDYFKSARALGLRIQERNEERRLQLQRLQQNQSQDDEDELPSPKRVEKVMTMEEPLSTSVIPGFTPPLFTQTTSRGNEKYFKTWSGEWHKGYMHGKGVYTFRDHSTYEGEIKGSRAHGHGTAKFVDGTVYVGQFKNGCVHTYCA